MAEPGPHARGSRPQGRRLGGTVLPDGIRFAVRSAAAKRVWVSLFDAAGEAELQRMELAPEQGGGIWSVTVPGLGDGTRYGFRADGDYAPEKGLWFDPDKLLTDPYAVEIDRPYAYDARLAARRGEGGDTAPLMPKAVARLLPEPLPLDPPLFRPGGLIYELSVRGFTMRHPDVPEQRRGTLLALAEPAVIEHLVKLGVSAVELMPVVAWIDERHLPPLGLRNAWGYNPVSFMALDPRLAPGGLADLRAAARALRQAGIGVILDLVFNHTGESDRLGPTLSLRGLDNRAYYRHHPDDPGRLVNDTGCGNTVACGRQPAHDLVVDTLRHFVRQAGVDGFRFDLAPVLARGDDGFDPGSALLSEIAGDPELAGRALIAEPWDIGPEGYRLGHFPPSFLEWNDRFRDDVRRFWRGDADTLPALATRLAGSSDVFSRDATRTMNFVAAHDGMTLADVTAYETKHNEANGEENRDGHGENLSWNNGVEGETGDAAVLEQRARDRRALLATLFSSRGTIMLTAGDEFGRSQRGNNNAYAQDNDLTWLDWDGRDRELERYACQLAALRRRQAALGQTAFLSGRPGEGELPDVQWLTETGAPMAEADWREAERRRLSMVLADGVARFAVLINGDRRARAFRLPEREGWSWRSEETGAELFDGVSAVPGRSLAFATERRRDADERG